MYHLILKKYSRKHFVIVVLLFSISTLTNASIKYDSSAKKCPSASKNNNYITVPLLHDLTSIAQTQNIPDLKTFKEQYQKYEGLNLSIYFEILNDHFDKNKELIILIPGGPGEGHAAMHGFEKLIHQNSSLFDQFNFIVMDHRGLGCSRPEFPGHEPEQFLTMRFAAADIELIRQRLSPNQKINIWGFSYGSMLAQTYSLLFPQNVDKLFLGGAFSSASTFTRARENYESLVVKSSIDESKYLSFIEKFPEYKDRFLNYTIPEMYTFEGRVKNIPKKFNEVFELLNTGDKAIVDIILPKNKNEIMPWMMRSIMCIEIMQPLISSTDAFPMFQSMVNSCKEFSYKTDFFNYTESLKVLPMDTFIWGGKYDHVTPIYGMQKMASNIPNNYFYIDQHIGHDFSRKTQCMIDFMKVFFTDQNQANLEDVAKSSNCTKEPLLN